MSNRKVRVGSKYIYYPVILDRIHPPFGHITPGTIVTVVNMPGCPPANTMGHAYVVHADGQFAGLVHTNSLYPMSDKQLVINALKADLAKKIAREVVQA